ncbi:murein transglycosylase A [Orrella sp. 11846]|uniref:murein transglycosylase A n=1 Tax=Orrella sp. 11846 TaxID=3409913 RepID=UPI003B5CCAF0
MKKQNTVMWWFSLGLAVLMAGCTTSERPGVLPGDEPVAADEKFRVVPLSSLPETKPRALSGRYVEVAWNTLPGWQGDDLQGYWINFLRNCQGLMRPTSGNVSVPARAAPRAWHAVCVAALDSSKAPAPNDAGAIRKFLQTYLTPWRLDTADQRQADGMVTGYYEPIVEGSRKRQGKYQWPLYGVPENLLNIELGDLYPELAGKRVRGKVVGNRVVPYDSRAQLAKSDDNLPVIVWLDDPVDNFFLQVQGSGRVHLADGPDAGQTIRLAYANHNGHPYKSIGRWLADQGELPINQASMQNIRAWAKKNPSRTQEMLNANPGVVFFREEAIADAQQGPKGAYGVHLGAQRAIAVDPTFVPLGTPVYLTTTMPASNQPLQKMVFAQDTGAAIKGAARADFYWGSGQQAGETAGRMKQRGQMWLLWPKSAGEPSAR